MENTVVNPFNEELERDIKDAVYDTIETERDFLKEIIDAVMTYRSIEHPGEKEACLEAKGTIVAHVLISCLDEDREIDDDDRHDAQVSGEEIIRCFANILDRISIKGQEEFEKDLAEFFAN